MNRLETFLVLALTLCGSAFAQEPGFRTPATGFVFDASVTGIRTIGGFPGATLLSDAITPPEGVSDIRFAPGQACALGLDADGRVYIMNADPGSPLRASLLDDVEAQPSSIQFNRAGSAVLLFFGGSHRLQVVTGLPHHPLASESFEVPDLAGEATAFALNDAGDRLAIGVTGQSRGAVYLSEIHAGQALQLRYVANAGAPSALTFSPSGKDLAIADKSANAVIVAKEAGGTTAALPVAGADDGIAEPSAVEYFDDATLLITNGASAELLLARFALDSSVTIMKLTAPSAARRLDRLSSSKVFLLTPVSSAPLALLDMSEQPRVFFIPANQSAKGN